MTVHPVPETYQAKLGPAEVAALNARFESDPDGFWLDLAERLAAAAEEGRVDLGDLGRRARRVLEQTARPAEAEQLF